MTEESREPKPEAEADGTPEPSVPAFTGRRRNLRTSRKVVLIDKIAAGLITVGGIGTILSVLAVALFLVWVVLPLFLPAGIEDLHPLDVDRDDILQIGIDEYQLLGWTLHGDGRIEAFRIDTGEVRVEDRLLEGSEIVSASFLVDDRTAAFGLADGTVQLVEIGFETTILDPADVPAEIRAQLEDENAVANWRDGVTQPTPAGQYRGQELRLARTVSSRVSTGPVLQIDHVTNDGGPLVLALVQGIDPGSELPAEEAAPVDPEIAQEIADVEPAGPETRLLALAWEEDTNFLTGEATLELRDPVALPYDEPVPPDFLRMNGAGTEAYLVWSDGRLEHFDTRDLDEAHWLESGSLLPPGSGETLRFFEPILGGNTFLWGSDAGRLEAGFPVRLSELGDASAALYDVERAPDTNLAFARTKSLVDAPSAAISVGSSARSRMAFTGFADGEIRLFNITNASQVRRVALPVDQPVLRVIMSPKEDGLLAATPEGLFHADLDPRYPEAGFSAFFRPVWYEGYSSPEHIWQSSSGSDDFEMKLGLMPLIFGTLKATFYSMLFGVPLALLAAIFTSEFLPARAKTVIKPSIEFMASLPSVVLGFLAALVFAPYIEKVVPATLGVFATVPFVLLLGAYLWQLLPAATAIRYAPWRFAVFLALVPVGIGLAGLAGPVIERWLFAGDVKGWLSWGPDAGLDERFADPTGGWMLLWTPIVAFAVAIATGRFIGPILRAKSATWDRRRYATADLAKFAAGLVVTFALAWVVSATLASLGLDPRGSFVDTYVQRNALVVGFVMGFAIIPIIYTISEDALSTVPEHLRSASLGAGATTWQTATRVVIPVAMSGLFSAMMIGLGRAVGETMIVLMAAGNTPVMDWNIFEGFRTLSANIAVELPEAVRGDTHYRTLFLAALVLFLMTFVVNTVAEVIRQRFRKRAYQL